MLVASIPSRIDARAARELLGVRTPEPLMERLLDEGLLHESGSAFRFHPLLRDFLRRKLESDEAGRHQELTEQAIARAKAEQRWEEAFDLSSHLSAQVRVSVVGAAAAQLLSAGRVETLQKWLDDCDAAGIAAPELLLARADIMLRRGELYEGQSLALDVAGRLPSRAALTSPAWHLSGRAAHLLSHDEEALAFHLRARDTAQSSEALADAVWGAAP